VLAIGQDVLEVGVEVQEPAGVHERGPSSELLLHHGQGQAGGFVTG
jgi:hypothetical protein